MVLIEFIRANYKFYHPEEIKIAFQIGVRGDLGNEKNKVEMNCFGDFSPLYFGSVMSAYRDFRNKASIELERKRINPEAIQKEPNETELKQIEVDFYNNVVTPLFDKWNEYGKLCFSIDSDSVVKSVYDLLVEKMQVLTFSNKDKKEIFDTVEMQMSLDESPEFENYSEFKKAIKLTVDELELQQLKKIKVECYKYCIVKCFEEIKTKNKPNENKNN